MARRNEQSLQSDSIMKNPFDITILCKVVDNFGDIGVVYRLAKSILNLSQNPQFAKTKIRLIVDDLTAFNKINDKIRQNKVCFGIFDDIFGVGLKLWLQGFAKCDSFGCDDVFKWTALGARENSAID